MALIKNVTEVKKIISIDASFNYETLIPYLDLAEDEVKHILGVDLTAKLLEFYEGGTVEHMEALLPYVQRPIVFFAILKGVDVFNVSIGNTGIGVVSTQHLAPASKERVANLKTSLSESAYDSLEILMEFLEENSDKYPTWKTSDAYSTQHKYLIPTARIFNEMFHINRCRVTYLEYRPTMADVELLQINPVVSLEFVNELKAQYKAGNMTEANKKVYTLLQKAAAYLTMAFFNDNKTKHMGEHFLMGAKQIMEAAIDSYPTYKASDCYEADLENYQDYENTDESGFAVFG